MNDENKPTATMLYKLISNKEVSLTEMEVNAHLRNGWELYGDPVVSLAGTSCTLLRAYAQAVVKRPIKGTRFVERGSE